MSNGLLVFTESYARGGGNRYMIDFANAVVEDFAQVTFASNPGGIYAEDLARFKGKPEVCSVPILTRNGLLLRMGRQPAILRRIASLVLLVCEPLLLLINVLLFCRLFARLKPRQIFAFNGGYPASSACQAAVVAARLYGVPAVLSIVSMPSGRRPYFWLYDAVLDLLIWRASRMVVVNAQSIAVALQFMRGLAGHAVVVHNGIDDTPAAVAEQAAGTVVIGCVARLDALKGVLVLLDAFTELAAERNDLRLVLAGEGDASAEMAARIKQRGLQDKVVLLGHFTGDVDALLRSFDVFAFPSLWEGFPYSIVEAMRSQRAIVATRVGGIPEAITDGREGLLVPPGDAAALLGALRRMINDAALREACAAAARARFLSDFSLPEMHRRARSIVMEGV